MHKKLKRACTLCGTVSLPLASAAFQNSTWIIKGSCFPIDHSYPKFAYFNFAKIHLTHSFAAHGLIPSLFKFSLCIKNSPFIKSFCRYSCLAPCFVWLSPPFFTVFSVTPVMVPTASSPSPRARSPFQTSYIKPEPSSAASAFLVKLDYVGIALLICGSGVPAIYYGFYCMCASPSAFLVL